MNRNARKCQVTSSSSRSSCIAGSCVCRHSTNAKHSSKKNWDLNNCRATASVAVYKKIDRRSASPKKIDRRVPPLRAFHARVRSGVRQYHDLLRLVLEEGQPRDDRTGTGTLSVFGAQTR